MASNTPLRVNARLELPGNELEVTTACSGGPGGQNVNRVETKVILRFSVAKSRALGERRRELLLANLANRLTRSGELVIHASSYREQARNETDARERLAEILRAGLHVPAKRRPTRPTRGSKERRLEAKRRAGARKKDRRGGGDDH